MDPAAEPLANVVLRKVGTAAVGTVDSTDCSASSIDDFGRRCREKDVVNSRKSSTMKELASHSLSGSTIGTLLHFLLMLKGLTAGTGSTKGRFSATNRGLRIRRRIGRWNRRRSVHGRGCCCV